MGSTIEEVYCTHRRNSELYKALMSTNTEDENKVVQLCRGIHDKALHIMTTQDDTVLHMAIYFKKSGLAQRLIVELLPDNYHDKVTRQNKAGNTILHEAATSDNNFIVADHVLTKAPGLLSTRNNNGETALFRAAQNGEARMFDYLAGKIDPYEQASKMPFLQRSDKSTILHVSILAQHFKLALRIANDYKNLIEQKDMDGMIPLQLLSCNEEAFKRKHKNGFFKKLIIKCVHFFRVILGWGETVGYEDQQYESAVELAKFLIEKDISWEFNSPIIERNSIKLHKYGAIPSVSAIDKECAEHGRRIDPEIPLFLAAKSGCVEIVKEIFETYPQSIGHIDSQGRNVLHVTIKYRQKEIFELVAKDMKVVMPTLVRTIDNDGNTILHMVGIKRKNYIPEKMEGTALELQEELLWYEQVEKVMIMNVPYLMHHQNGMGMTAKQLFAATNNELRSQARHWLKSTAEGCTVVAVLIATVAFAAAYTIPGGPNQNTGFPILVDHPFFLAFTICDILSLAFSLASVVIFLSVLSSPFRLKDFKQSLPLKLALGFLFMFLSVSMMMIAFGATVLLMIKKKGRWEKILLYTFSVIPIGLFSLSYFPLYVKTSTSRALKYCLRNKIRQLTPRCFLDLLKKTYCFSNRTPRVRANSSSIP